MYPVELGDRGPPMTFEALLTFFGILVAILAVARPVQRASLRLFVRRWLWVLLGSIVLSVALIFCRHAPFGLKPPFGWPLSKVMFGLTFGAFAVPVLAAVGCWASWERAKLNDWRAKRVIEHDPVTDVPRSCGISKGGPHARQRTVSTFETTRGNAYAAPASTFNARTVQSLTK
jgi:hypothetical protein